MSKTNPVPEPIVAEACELTHLTPQPHVSSVEQCDSDQTDSNRAELQTSTAPVTHNSSVQVERHSEENPDNQSTFTVESREATVVAYSVNTHPQIRASSSFDTETQLPTSQLDRRLPVRESLGISGCLVVIGGSVLSIIVVRNHNPLLHNICVEARSCYHRL